MKSAEITQEVKDSIIRFYNNYYTLEKIKNIYPMSNNQYYQIINEAREKGLITIPKHSPKPKPQKPPKVLKQNLYDVKKIKEPEIYEAIKKYYSMGYRYEDITQAVGVNNSRVKYYLGIAFYRNELKPNWYKSAPRSAIKWTTADVDRIKEMYYNGYSMLKIANQFGVVYQTIARIIKKLDLHRADVNTIRKSRILVYYRSGLTYKQIAYKMEMSVGYVVKAIGDQKNRNHPHLTANEISTIFRMYQEGYSVAYISNYFGVNSSTIYSRLKKSGIERKQADM